MTTKGYRRAEDKKCIEKLSLTRRDRRKGTDCCDEECREWRLSLVQSLVLLGCLVPEKSKLRVVRCD